MRSITKCIPAKSFADNSAAKQSYRVIGSTDINGKGTAHANADVDPFIFLDETCMNGNEPWPFPKHPHCGLIAMTYMLSGEIQPWDNHRGTQPFTNSKGGLYYIQSGLGLLHEEVPVISAGPLRWLQLWVNQGLSDSALTTSTVQLIKPEQIPVYESDEALIRVVIGDAFGVQSATKPDWPIQYLHVFVKSGCSVTLPVPDKNWQGFCYVLEGSGIFGTNKIVGKVRDCLVLGNEPTINILVTNTAHTTLEFVFLCGQPHQQAFYKILGGGGALIADSEESARAALLRYGKNPDKFGC